MRGLAFLLALLLAGCASAPPPSDTSPPPTTSSIASTSAQPVPPSAAQAVDDAKLTWSYNGDGRSMDSYASLVELSQPTTVLWTACLPGANACYLPAMVALLPAHSAGNLTCTPRPSLRHAFSEDEGDFGGAVPAGRYHVVIVSGFSEGGLQITFGSGSREVAPSTDPTLTVVSGRADDYPNASDASRSLRLEHAGSARWWAWVDQHYGQSGALGAGAPELTGAQAIDLSINAPCATAQAGNPGPTSMSDMGETLWATGSGAVEVKADYTQELATPRTNSVVYAWGTIAVEHALSAGSS